MCIRDRTIGEDPYLVGTIGSAYVRGVESAGVVATLKHFVGYSASRSGRNLAPVSIGARELADVFLPPFEMALRSGARSVMNSYTDLDGVPVASDGALVTELLRGKYGFEGTVVSDYFAVAFLQKLHGVAGSPSEEMCIRDRSRWEALHPQRSGGGLLPSNCSSMYPSPPCEPLPSGISTSSGPWNMGNRRIWRNGPAPAAPGPSSPVGVCSITCAPWRSYSSTRPLSLSLIHI